MGSEATRDLATTSDFDEITIADLDREKAQALAGSLNASTGRGHVQAVHVDASDEDALVTLLRGQDVAVNTLTYHFGLQATRAAIRAGVNYLDLGGLHNTPKQLALDHEAQAAGVTIVLGCGATPGVTNILARRGADDLDTVEAVHIAFASHRSIALSPGLLDTILDEFSPEASRFYYEDGHLVQVQPFDGAQLITFQPPVGEQEVYRQPDLKAPVIYPGDEKSFRVWGLGGVGRYVGSSQAKYASKARLMISAIGKFSSWQRFSSWRRWRCVR
jgi:lysine 6-dehydrogenase